MERDDEPLGSERAAESLRSQFPDLFPARVTYLGEGCDSVAFDVDGANGEWVFRFPKRADVERQLLVELRVLPLLAARSPEAPIPVPHPLCHGQPSAAFPRHFMGYRKLPGVSAIQLDPARIPFDRIAPQLGRFLSWLHRVPVGDARAMGVEAYDLEAFLEETRAEALEEFPNLSRVNLTPGTPIDDWHVYLKEGVPSLRCWPLTPALAHTDLAAEHILLDRDTWTVTGIIDWSDMAVLDPGVDFAGLFHWGGEAFVRGVLDAYGGDVARPAVRDALLRPARYLAACRGVLDVTFGLERHRPEYIAGGLRALTLCVPAETR